MPINSFLYPAPSTPSFVYNVANSLRFNRGSSDYLNVGQASGNRKTFTWSCWVKRAELGTGQMIWHCNNAGHYSYFYFDTDDTLHYYDIDGATQTVNYKTNRVFRDPSSWYHLLLRVDTTQGTEADRIRIYVNGTQETSFAASQTPSQNTDLEMNVSGHTFRIGTYNNTGNYFGGYLAECVFCDGQSLAPTSFGEFDSDTPNVWKPIEISGLTFGTNGFYLEFKQTGTSADSSGLGADTSGNDKHHSVNNLTSIDQSTDTCTNNFATLNPLAGNTAITFSEGNLKAVFAAQSSRDICQSGFGVSNGKWYWEVKGNNSYGRAGGITAKGHDTESNNVGGSSFSYGYYGDNGTIYNNNSNSGLPTYATYASNTIGVYLDLDNNKLYFSKDGSLQSTTGISITDPASLGDNFYFPAVSNGESGQGPTFEFNFGSPAYSISSGNTDDNGYGNFEYSPNITGDGSAKKFYALNTKNLAEFG